MEAIKSENYKRFKIEYWYDDYNEDPRNWDDLSKMICFTGNKYDLGNKHSFSSPEDLSEFLTDNAKNIVYLPIYIFDHGNITIKSSPFSCQWDSGQIGYIYAYKDKLIESGFKDDKAMMDYLESEIKTYDDYIRGNCYGYSIYDDDNEILDSCGGFLGSFNYVEKEAKNNADYYDNKLPLQLTFNFQGV
jgi:hypothetical protein